MIPGGSGVAWPIFCGALGLAAASGGAAALLHPKKRTEAAKTAAVSTLAAVAVWETGWYLYRWRRRTVVYEEARATAKNLGRQLIVIGAPDGGVTSGYGCGDQTIDISPTSCPNWKPLDITKTLPYADNSVVVFCSCVLEYVSDPIAAIAEIKRISGGYTYFVGVEPWTLAGLLYPGAKQTLPAAYR